MQNMRSEALGSLPNGGDGGEIESCPKCGKRAPYLGTYADFSVRPRSVYFACACGYRPVRLPSVRGQAQEPR